MSAFVLKKDYALQLPSSYVDIDREEMEYLDGGAFISNKFMAGIIDTAIWCIPSMKAFKGTLLGLSLMSYSAKLSVSRAIAGGIAKIGLSWLGITQSRILGVIMNFTGFSIGTYIAEKLIDPRDGNRYNKGFKF
ncbi:hypothetical protein PMY12_08630 [Clostridium tertium]|uniref:hypothetical protein n=1 Tax=Clostridium tertium TaxID=1559 RepID=UPI00232F051B|nr:hypothetical protein [Clostridium tertium]MDB1934047.1 hypothetical protein [Clostridium tertium]MDB1937078.1 hypothetical protein [Clostridium tertium]